MQVFGLPRHVIRTGRLASRIAAKLSSREAALRSDAVSRWREGMQSGLSALAAARIVGVPRSTLYRWQKRPEPQSRRPHRRRRPAWPPALVQAVEELRADNPMWGKRKLAVLLRREGFAVSLSTIGRILRHLMQRGVVTPVPTLRRKPGGRRFRLIGKRHAKRLPKGLKPSRPGEIVQVDTMFISPAPGQAHKHFTAYDPVAKWTVAGVAGRASANLAASFLDKLLADMPFKVTGIQVDGGSEFRADFERACESKGLNLYVLPPKRPQLNGAVERCNGAWRYEFYAAYDLPHRLQQLQPLVDAFAHRFNHHRPHDALDGRTPAEYLQSFSSPTQPSHMS
jgi:transposase InsO family protein